MQFGAKKLFFIYAFVLSRIVRTILSLELHNYTFIAHYRSPIHKFALNLESELMPRPSRKVQRETSLSKKKVHERIRQTLKGRKTKTKEQEKEERQNEVESWRVILYNDDIHSFSYVTESLANCVPQLTIAKAHLLTLQAHKTGQAEILRTWKDKAEQYCRALQKYGLTVCTINEDYRKPTGP